MQQLSGLDTSFLNMETPTTYGHVSGLTIYDPSTASEPVTFERLKDLIEERMHLVPLYRRRLVEVPLGLDHPYWIEDPDFDLDFHMRHIAVPPPGTPQQLSALVSRIAARPLDRSRPLWELYMIEGLQDGYIAHLTKVHHCAIDGVSGAEILTTLLDLTPEPRKIDPPRRGWRPEPEPTQLEMLARTAWGMLGAPRKVWRLQRQAIRYLPELAQSLGFKGFPGQSIIDRVLRRQPTPMMSEAPTTAPRMSFNGRITPHRRFAFGSISLEDVKEIKNKLGVTVNDVVMALCAGALRRYLLQQNELPPEPLVAMVPVSVRSDDDKQALGNQISAMTASLHTHIAEPIERIKRIHESMRIAKEQHQALPATLLQDFAQFAPPAVAARAARVIARATVANWVDPPFNVVISNVPGPQFPLYGVGAKVVGNYPVSAINDGVALNMTVMSYNGNVDFGLLSCRELMPDIWDLMDFIYDSLAELKEAAKSI
ncbi:MAG: wax ester/triacylglycerol synthase family O-acyltransferase [Deltaproteobacteria bacterium]|nr:wax ester/triacylglycerol synthase family O-acyltransferase [Deltaproteobacteria bacterium]MBW2415730.1 wax ester/triacylglycerol synthase family O-acyltransferase [Deltaproteobacteria bacterium]